MTAQKHIEDVKYIQIKLASPEKIISEWSNGEVETHETINYRTLKPELGGLFCERIFGPQKDYECHCGKYKKSTYKGKRCEICGVDIISAKVRRQRKGHIKLEEPVVSPMYKKHIMTLLGCKMRDIDALMQYNAYIVTKSNNSQLPAGSITEEEDKLVEMKGIEYKSGTIGLYEYLKNYDIDKEIRGMEDDIIDIKKNIVSSKSGGSGAKNDDNLRKINAKLELLLNFRNSGNRPEWLVMTVIPVIPPDLRPLVQIGSGRFVVSGLNELYRKVIIRNNRLKEMKNVHAAELLLNDGRVALQRAVEELFDNSKNNESVSASNRNKKIQKSLVEMLKGKQGRFRQNLLGKRVDFSGRSVIVVGPNLKLDECGLPKKMALELFKPFVIADLLKSGKAFNIKFAKIKIENQEDDVWEALERVIKTKKVLLNRAPTLHRLGIQAFRPRIVEGKAIRLSPLVCTAYNADFDGDQMAVHLPLSDQAQREATKLMLASNNILNPKDGQPIVAPSQDMILGNYYVSIENENKKVFVFKSEKEATLAFENRYITLQDRVFIRATGIEKGYLGENLEDKLLFTTVGKIIFNKITPDDYHFINEANIENFSGIDSKYIISMGTNLQEYLENAPVNIPFKKGFLSELIYDIFEKYDIPETSKMLDSMKDLGYKYSALSGISISFADVPTVDKHDILEEAQNKVDEWNALHGMGLITEEERYQRITQNIWPEAGERITDNLMKTLDNTNNIFMMSDSGARGNRSNFKQLGAMRGLMAAPSGEIIELPVKSSFKEGLSVLEYFISSHGARKGLADTALKTADSGYLTLRLVDVAQDVVVTEEDCHTYDYNVVSDIREGTEVIEKLKDRIIGRFAAEQVLTQDGKVIIEKDEMFSEAQAEEVIANNITEVKLRTIFTCKSKQGVCQKCYGRDLSTNKLVNVGEAVGIVSAQSIGEPGTQLTMRTFHTGGVAGNDITQGLPRIVEILEARTPKGKAVIATETGELEINEKSAGHEVIIKNGKEILSQEIVPHGYKIKYNSGDMVRRGDLLTEGSVHTKELLEYSGVEEVRKYILKEIQKVYRLQGVGINDKHIEIIVSQMLKFIRVVDSGSTDLISGELLRYSQLVEANLGSIRNGKDTAIAVPAVMGIKEASLKTESFLSAASFQETAKVLANATVRGKKDYLRGVKENVIVGKLIPAGTGKVDNYKGINDELIAAAKEAEEKAALDALLAQQAEV
ncbi:DNA-directed RNA polymerase subunit beta' [Mollicutes bacterium LVI A0039]|nr:DNA-directed RNA polymerase subunit beta' [Mollicutes bacterium LVI A0039]